MSHYPDTVFNWLEGSERPAESGGRVDIVSPHSGEIIGKLVRSGEADVNKAVAAARAAQPAGLSGP